MNAQLARRIAALRACENIADIHIVALDDGGNRALVRLVPKIREDALTGADWQQPDEPFLMLIDSAALLDEHALH